MPQLTHYAMTHTLAGSILDTQKGVIESYDKRHFAEVFDLDITDPHAHQALDRLVEALQTDENDLLWWLVVHATKTHATREARHQQKLGTDHLTGALNGAGFSTWLHGRFIGAGTESLFAALPHLTAILIDLVNLKRINDLLGYTIGDEVIKEAVSQLRAVVCKDEDAAVIRFSGDELAIAAAGLTEERGLELLRRIHAMQLVKLKDKRHLSAWKHIQKLKQAAGPRPLIEVRQTQDDSFGQALARTKKEVCIAGQPAVELDDLVIMAAGLAYGPATSKQECRKLMIHAEHEMKNLKEKYHRLMGGAYRNVKRVVRAI